MHTPSLQTNHPQEETTNFLINHYKEVAAEFRSDVSRQHLAIIAMGILKAAQDILDSKEYLRLISETGPIMRRGNHNSL